jgi:hypothetical protein
MHIFHSSPNTHPKNTSFRHFIDAAANALAGPTIFPAAAGKQVLV